MNTAGATGSGGQRDSALLKAVSVLRSINLNGVSSETVRQSDMRYSEIINNSPLQSLERIRPNLNPEHDYVAYIIVLHAALAAAKASDVQAPYLLSAYARFALDTRDYLARLLPERWCGIGRHACRLAVDGGKTQQCLSLIEPLRVAADKIAPSPDHLVPLHADLLLACIESKMYQYAARWAHHRRLRVDTDATAMDASDVLLIYYHIGIVFIGIKQFRCALDNFRIALAVPVNTVGRLNELMLSVYKKFVLMNVLVHGSAPQQPLKFCSYNTNRLRNAATEYVELSSAYSKRKLNDLNDIVELNKIQFEKDGNLGLAHQIIRSLPKLIIKRLTNSFVTMRLDDVAVRAGLANKMQAENLLVEMISDASIRAHIDGKDNVVRFISKTESADGQEVEPFQTPAGLLTMNENIQRCLAALRRIQLFRDNLLTDVTYIKKENQMSRQNNNTRDSMGFMPSEDAEMEAKDFGEDGVL